MLKGKALDILKTLSGAEYKKFEAFTESPYFNTNKSLSRLVTQLKHFHPDFSSEKMTEEFIYEKVFGKNKFSYSVIRNLMSELLGLCEKFLLAERYNGKMTNHDVTIALIEELQARNLDNLLDLKLKKITVELSKAKVDVELYRLHLAVIDFHLDYLFNKITFKKILGEKFQEKALYKLLDITNSLYRNAGSIYYASRDFNFKPEDNIFYKLILCIDFKKYLGMISDEKVREVYIVRIYVMLSLLIIDPDDLQNFLEVKKIIFENINKFANLEKYSLLNVLRNYAQLKMLHGDSSFNRHGHDINKMILDSVDFRKDKLDSVLGLVFLSFVHTALLNRDFDETEAFINKYAVLLRKEVRNHIYGYSMAMLNFERKNFEKALQNLATIKALNNVYFIRVKEMYFKIYYEMNFIDEAFSLLDTYKHFISNNGVHDSTRRAQHHALHRIFYKMLRMKSGIGKYSEYDVAELHKTVKDINPIHEKNWIIDKLGELSKQYS